MNLKSISFKNYKAFSEKQTIDIKPITVLIGKNSSGKSAVTKLFTLLENSLSGFINTPILLNNNGIDLGGDFRDIVYNKIFSLGIDIELLFKNDTVLKIALNQYEFETIILKWEIISKSYNYNFVYNRNKKKYEFENNFYDIEFKGFIPNKIIKTNNKNNIHLDLSFMPFSLDYIGPFRVIPSRTFTIGGNVNEKMGISGENAYRILGESKIKKTDLIEKVGNWYKEHFDGWKLDIYENNYPNLETVLIKETKPKDFRININYVGEGMSQVLPLVVNAFQKTKMFTIIEQPELHLHPEAHADLSELFALTAIKENRNFLIETHSENFILRLRRLIVEEKINCNDVIIYWLEEGEEGHSIEPITISEKGVLSNWPEGVFNENIEEIAAIKKAVKKGQI